MDANRVLITGLQGQVCELQIILGRALTAIDRIVERLDALENHVFNHSGLPVRRTQTGNSQPKNQKAAVLRLVKPRKEVENNYANAQ